MRTSTYEQYTALLRNDFVGFAHRAFLELYPQRQFEASWHIEVVASKLEAVRRGEIKRLIINIPPRNLKSFLGSIVFPAYFLGHNPSSEVLCTSYGEFPIKSQSLDCRNLMLSPFYQALFETRLSEDRQAVEEFKTTAGGARRGLSLRGSITGSGADLIVVDDPIKAEDAMSETIRDQVNSLFYSSIDTRTNRDTGAIVIIMQRLHQNDLCGFVQKRGKWDVLALPAIAEENETYRVRTPYGARILRRTNGEAIQPLRQSIETLKEKRLAQGARTFDAQYQQKPHGAEGALIERDWLVYYDENTKPARFDTVLQSWDTANKQGDENSYSVCTKWGIKENRFYLLDVFRDRLKYLALKDKAISLAREEPRPTTILIEEQTQGSPLAEDLAKAGFPVELVPTGNATKVERLYARVNRFANGQVLLPRDAPWLEAYVDELTTFPDSDFSDQVDSTSQALTHDASSTGFNNAIGALKLLANGSPYDVEPKRTIKLRVLPGGGGGTVTFADGSGRPNFDLPGPGKEFEIDRDIGVRLAQSRWKEFQIVNE